MNNIVKETPIWPGSSSFAAYSASYYSNTSSLFPPTAFGFYDNDEEFKRDADKIANFCARRLGYPILDVELQDINFWTAFEDAITTYGNEVYSYKIKENYLSLEGLDPNTNLNSALITPNMGTIIRISEQYGTEAGVGGNITYRTGSIDLIEGQQNYDLNVWASSSGISEGDLEIKRIFYEQTPAIVRFFDPYAGTGNNMQGMLDAFGWGSYSPGVSFMLTPIYQDLQRIQAIEFNDQIRKSSFSFELVNNQLRIFPIPNNGFRLRFEYILKSDRQAATIRTGSYINNILNVPYTNPEYSKINSVGRSWIFEYCLALSKEMLGYIRGKYDNIPVSEQDNVKLNSSDLLASSGEDKKTLIENLRTYLEDMSRDKLMERKANEADYKMKEISQVPLPIFIG